MAGNKENSFKAAGRRSESEVDQVIKVFKGMGI